MPGDIERKLSEQDKALLDGLGRNLGKGSQHLPAGMDRAPTHTPNVKDSEGSGRLRERSLGEDQAKGPKGSLADRLKEHREQQQGRPESAKAQEQGRER